jgi:type II secretory pathway pseudopilin PulG
MKRKQIKAFSLLEIGLVLLIIGVLGVSLRPVLTKQLQQHNDKLTQNKQQCIAESLAAFVLQNNCLPEASIPSQAGEPVSGKYIGIVPYKALNLDPRTVKDKNGFWFTYAVNEALTETKLKNAQALDMNLDINSDAIFCTAQSNTHLPKIKDHPAIGDCIAFVLVSHYNGNGAFKSDDSRDFREENSTPQTMLEALNASDTGTFSSEHVRDIVFWVSRYNLMAQIAKKPCIPKSLTQHNIPQTYALPSDFEEDMS